MLFRSRAQQVRHVVADWRDQPLPVRGQAQPAIVLRRLGDERAFSLVRASPGSPQLSNGGDNYPGTWGDRFHVAKHLGDAVNRVRAEEHRALAAEGDLRLKKTRYLWLRGEERLTPEARERFAPLRDSNFKVARAWALKETARDLWNYVRRGNAWLAWTRWLAWASRCRLAPVIRVAQMIRKHLTGIVNAIVHHVTSARCEGINAKVQWIKRLAFGFQNRERFRNAICFHLGGLDLYPSAGS